jgi:nucleotide-binding universal stress UspA family protein
MTSHKVLVPLDGSDFSRQILPHVRSFLDPAENELILLRVGSPPESIRGAPPRPATAEVSLPLYESERDAELAEHPIYTSQSRESLQASLADELQTDLTRLEDAGYSVSVAIRLGDAAQEIIDFVEEAGVDLVTMTTHGRKGVSRLLFGSVAERVLRSLSVPVMLVRPIEEPVAMQVPGQVLAARLAQEKPLRMVVATDGSPFAESVTAFAGDLARALNAEVTLLVAVREKEERFRGQEVLDEARDLLGEMDPVPESVLLVGFADEVITQYLAEMPADLLIIGAFGDRGTSRFLIGTTAQRLVHNAPSSVLVVKGQRPAFSKILACTAIGDEVVVDVAGRLAKALGAEMQLLHVVPPTAAMYLALPDAINIPLNELLSQDTPLARHLKTCVARLKALSLDGRAVKVRRGAVPDTIFQEARAGAFDLIVVGSRAGAIKDPYFATSIADRVVKHAHRPVLVVRTTEQ